MSPARCSDAGHDGGSAVSRPGPLRVLVVEDHVLLADTLTVAHRAEGLVVEKAELGSREALVAQVAADPPDLVLLDLELVGELGEGSTLVRPFVQAGARVLVLGANGRPTQVGTSIEQGAVGHLPKTVSFESLLATVTLAARGEAVMTADERRAVLRELADVREREAIRREPFERLSRREQQVLRALGNGKPVAEIAAEWFVSEATVRSQVRGVLTKLGVGSQLEAVALALRAGWIGEGRNSGGNE